LRQFLARGGAAGIRAYSEKSGLFQQLAAELRHGQKAGTSLVLFIAGAQ
jgi:hypothetical protein